MRVLGAVDFGPTYEAVVEATRYLGEALDLEPLLVHVVPTRYLESLAQRFPDLQTSIQELFTRVRTRIQETLEATNLPGLVLSGWPAYEIGGEAAKSRLVVLGQVEEGALERIARGGIARYLLHRAEAPVVLVPPGQPLRIKRIAVGLDETPASLSAFRLAQAVAEKTGAEVVGLHMVSPERGCCFPTYLDPKGLEVSELLQKAQSTLERLLQTTGVVNVAKGEEGGDLLRLAHAHKADLLVLGSKAKSSWRNRLGRMVEVLLTRADLPLLIVPEATHW
ncbi:MAG: universal stress protein [Thermaceae bacterium]